MAFFGHIDTIFLLSTKYIMQDPLSVDCHLEQGEIKWQT